MVRDVELGTLCPKFKTKRAPTCLGNFLGNCNYRIGVIPIKIGVLSANSMVSGPTNLRCSGTIGKDRGGTGFGPKRWKYRRIGLELVRNDVR
jgi:hypothetical protein